MGMGRILDGADLHLPRHNSDSVRATPLLEFCKTAHPAPFTLDGLVSRVASHVRITLVIH
jgi:hypothetical protein